MILAIDTSTQWMGIALYDGSLILYEKIWKAPTAGIVLSCLQRSRVRWKIQILPFKDLKAVAVAIWTRIIYQFADRIGSSEGALSCPSYSDNRHTFSGYHCPRNTTARY